MAQQPRKMFIPAFSIVAMVITLLVIISVSTYRNLDRDKREAMGYVHRECLALINALETGARVGLLHHDIHADQFGRLIREASGIRDVAYILLVDKNGRIIQSADPAGAGITEDFDRAFFLQNAAGDGKGRIRMLGDHTKVYETAKRFRLPATSDNLSRPGPDQSDLSAKKLPGSIMIIGLKMKSFEAARKADFHHAIIMAAIVFALGSGTIFFIFVIQNYYLVNRTLKQARDYNRVVVDHMANGLISIDISGKVQTCNHQAAELLGIADAELNGEDLKHILDFEQSGISKTLNNCATVMEREIQVPICPEGDGTRRHLAVSVTPILTNNRKCGGAVIILRDLTELKQLEAKVRRSEKLAAIGKLAASVAHEIRNPLSSIRGFAHLLAGVLSDSPKEKKYADVMVQEVDRINRVVSDLLIFARPLELELRPTDICEMVEHVAALAGTGRDSGHVDIRTQCPEHMERVDIDGGLMTSVLFNLVLNAMQSMEDGGQVDIGVSMNREGGARLLRLWVSDNGPGIPADRQKTIFEPFYTTREKGTGLGLAIAHKIVENHGGRIGIQSPAPGETAGSRFDIRIPLGDG